MIGIWPDTDISFSFPVIPVPLFPFPIPRTTGNILGTLCSKSVRKSIQAKSKITDAVSNNIKGALEVVDDHKLEVPGHILNIAKALLAGERSDVLK